MTTPPTDLGPTRPPEASLADGGPTERDDAERTILIVDDEEDFAHSVAFWLDPECETVVATNGAAALEAYGPDVDAVLLDRRMPGQSGEEVLEAMRERDGDARIAMVTALEPDWDVVDMDYDMYLKKPVTESEVVDAVEELFERAEYARELQALFALSAKIADLEAKYPKSELEDDERFEKLTEEFERVQEQARPYVGDLGPEEWAEVMQVVEDGEGSRDVECFSGS